MLLARQYNLFPGLDDLTGIDLLLTDAAILNQVIDKENKAQEAAMKKDKEKRDHPGMEKFEDPEDFWGEVDAANGR